MSLSAYSSRQLEVYSFTGNQAALAKTKHSGVAILGERPFMIAQLANYRLAGAFSSRLGNFGLQFHYEGFSMYTAYAAGLAYARNLGSKVSLGLQFDYYANRVPGYGGESYITAEAGALFQLTEQCQAGIHVYNPVPGRRAKGDVSKPSPVYRLGVGYDASPAFFVAAECIREANKPVNITGGIQYQFMKQFFAACGFSGDTGSGYAGAGVAWKIFRVDLSGSYHPQLGFSPGILFTVHFK